MLLPEFLIWILKFLEQNALIIRKIKLLWEIFTFWRFKGNLDRFWSMFRFNSNFDTKMIVFFSILKNRKKKKKNYQKFEKLKKNCGLKISNYKNNWKFVNKNAIKRNRRGYLKPEKFRGPLPNISKRNWFWDKYRPKYFK